MFSEAEIKKRKEEIIFKRMLWQEEMEKRGARPVGKPSSVPGVGHTTYIKKIGDYFMLYTGDRTAYLTEEFLDKCAPDWAQELREAMANWS